MVIHSAVEGLACLSHVLLCTVFALDKVDNIVGRTACICLKKVCLSSDLASKLVCGEQYGTGFAPAIATGVVTWGILGGWFDFSVDQEVSEILRATECDD